MDRRINFEATSPTWSTCYKSEVKLSPEPGKVACRATTAVFISSTRDLRLKGVTEEVVAEVRRRANVLEVISESVVLKRAGKEHKGLCPFHQEKSPSFSVNPDKGIYKCFGCGEGGDVFQFTQKFKGLNFIDAVRELAHKYNVPLVETEHDRQEHDKRSRVFTLYQKASEYFCQLLGDPTEGAVAREYLEKRGMSAETIARFRLGYAPNGWDGLIRYLTSTMSVSPATLEEAGLVRRNQEGTSYYDFFRNRLMIPVCDDHGRVIAFGGRALGDDSPKYLNSPETPIYIKSKHLFGFHLAKDSIKERDSVIVVEGYFDVITPHQYGFTNTVAAQGASLSEEQARSLVRYTDSKRVYLSFDADAAGTRAMNSGVEKLNQIAEGIGIELRVINIPGGKDPDECLRAPDGQGPYAFARAIETAPLLIDHQLNKIISEVNYTTHTGKIDAAKRVVPVLAQIKDAVGRGEYIRNMCLKLNLREEDLIADVGEYRRKNGLGRPKYDQFGKSSQGNQNRPQASRNSMKAGYVEAEQQLLALFLTSRDDNENVSTALGGDRLITEAHQRIKEALEGIGTQFNNVEDLQYKLMDRLVTDQEAAASLIEVILKVEEIRKVNAPVGTLLVECKARLLKERVSQLRDRLKSLLITASDESEQEAMQSRIMQMVGLEKNLVSASTLSEIDELKRKIEEIAQAHSKNPNLETTV